MRTVNIHEAKTHLSRLIEAAAKGEPFIIAKAGKPLVKVMAVDAPAAPKRFDFMKGQFTVPDDFDTMRSEGNRATVLRRRMRLLLDTHHPALDDRREPKTIRRGPGSDWEAGQRVGVQLGKPVGDGDQDGPGPRRFSHRRQFASSRPFRQRLCGAASDRRSCGGAGRACRRFTETRSTACSSLKPS